MSKIDWQKGCKDAMWSMFWITKEHGDSAADESVLKENVARLICLATQKDAGQRRHAKSVDWNALTPTLMNIAISATALCLEGRFGDMPEYIEEP